MVKIIQLLDGTPAVYGKRQSGQSVVELALITPILIILLAGLVEIGWFANNYLNLLDVTRLESGHVRPKLDWCDVGDLVQTTVRSLDRELAGRELKVEVAAKIPLARLDFTFMQQALSNLLLNAVAHTPAGTPVLLQARHEAGWLVFHVADSGPGLSPELLPRIFDKFFRAPNAPAGGSGLGLAIVKGFVEAHGGQISAANRTGGGAIFTIKIPQTALPPEEKPS